MKLNYYPDTDSLTIALSLNPSTEGNEVAEGVLLDFDADGRLVGIDIDNASHKLDLHELTTEQIPVQQARRDKQNTKPALGWLAAQ